MGFFTAIPWGTTPLGLLGGFQLGNQRRALDFVLMVRGFRCTALERVQGLRGCEWEARAEWPW